MKLKVKKLRENALLPKRMTKGSAGCDLCACIDKPLAVPPNKTMAVPTGIAVSLEAEDGYVLLVYARSSLALKRGIALINSVGVIDLDYRGEIIVPLHNFSDTVYEISPNERIAQLIAAPVVFPEIVQAQQLDDTLRGEGGFGSTGK